MHRGQGVSDVSVSENAHKKAQVRETRGAHLVQSHWTKRRSNDVGDGQHGCDILSPHVLAAVPLALCSK